jgi:Tfp pilus assembly protein PilO
MNRLSSTNQLIIAGVLILAISAAVVVFGIMPMFQKAADIDVQLLDADMQLQTANALVERRLSAKARAASNEVELMSIANQIPESPQLPSVIIELQDTANASGLDFVQITPGAPSVSVDNPAYSVMPLTLVLQGDWADVIEYTRKVQKLQRGVRTTAGTFSRVEETDAAGDVTSYIATQMSLEVYVMNTPAPATAQ